METVADIFTQAGWSAGQKDGWNGAFVWADQSVVGGIDPWGVPRVTVVGARSHEDAAAWLIEHAKQLRLEPLAPAPEPEETAAHEAISGGARLSESEVAGVGSLIDSESYADPRPAFEEGQAHEAHEETGAEEDRLSSNVSGELGGELREQLDEAHESWAASFVDTDSSRIGDAEGRSLGAGPGFSSEDQDHAGGAEPIDADFYEPDAPAIEGADLEDAPPEEHASGAFIFGDNLAQLRTSAIGLVVQISLAKQEAIWAEAGAGPDEYGQLTGAVVRDTVDGLYRGDPGIYDRFVALSRYDHAARDVQATERAKVTALTSATREEIEAFDPEAGWPA